MALMMAIDRLQAHTGPDTRVTAPANIIAPDAPFIVGAWRSWEGDNHDGDGRPVSPDYSSKTRSDSSGDGRFISWLVSGAIEGEHLDSPSSLVHTSSAADGSTVALLAKGSLGVNPGQIHLPIQTINSNGNSAPNGGYAWWVSPENQKAHLQHPYKPRSNDAAGWSELAHSHPVIDPTPFGMDALLDDPENHVPGQEPLKAGSKAFSLQSTALVTPGNPLMPEKSFHDLSVTAEGLLTNTATGGWRKDLSILSEKWDSINASYEGGNLPLFRISPQPGDTSAAQKPTTSNPHAAGSIFYPWSGYPNTDYSMLPVHNHGAASSWQALVDFATSYKTMDWDGQSASIDTAWDMIYTSGGGRGTMNQQHFYKFLHSYRIHPIFARVQHLFKMRAERRSPDNPNNKQFQVRLLWEPVYTIWNPYNVALKVNERYGMNMHKAPHVAIGLVNGNKYTNPENDKSLHKALVLGSRYDMESQYQSGSGLSADEQIPGNYGTNVLMGGWGQVSWLPESLTLEPGETRVYAPVSGTADNSINGGYYATDLAEGYDGSKNIGKETGLRGDNTLKPQSTVLSGTGKFPLWNDPVLISMRFDKLTRLGQGDDKVGPGVIMTIGTSTPGWDVKNVNQAYSFLSMLTNLDFALKYWDKPSDLPEFTISDIAVETETGGATNNPPWTPAFSLIFGPRISIGAGAGNENDRPTKGVIQNNPFTAAMLTTSLAQPTNHPANMIFDIAVHGHRNGGSPTLPEDSPKEGYAFSGFQQGDGLSRLVMAELPLGPIASLPELQSWNLQGGKPIPPFQYNIIGNSDATPMISKDDIIPGDPLTSDKAMNLQHDDAYCANHLLFDDWFFSTIAPQADGFDNGSATDIEQVCRNFLMGEGNLLNRSYLPIPADQGLSSSDADDRVSDIINSSDGWLKVASRIKVKGMFNINSTSVKAWRALLGHARRQQVAHHTKNGITLDTTERDHVISRFAVAGDVKAGTATGMGAGFPSGSEYAGFRTLNDDQLDQLAQQIVEQVKKRGPFLSLSEFVNRRLTNDDDELAIAGAVQTALNSLTGDDDPMEALRKPANKLSSETMDPDEPNDDKLDGVGYSFKDASRGMSTHGFPGWIRQADILRPIAPVLSVRDDTFTIRAYGDVRDARGRIIATAWCEATVSRTRDFVDGADAPDTAEPPTSEANKKFGRRYTISSFRWLASNEV